VIGNVYYEFAALLFTSAVIGAIAVRLRQPLIVAFIVVGILVGPAVLGMVSAHDQIGLLSQIGVTVLLFVVGLKLDMHLVRHLGPVALATGLGQLGFTIIFGFLIGLGLGMDWLKSLYVAVALTFSSTIIIVKLLSDKREIDSLHGRIAMGFLIVQDIAVVIAMMVVGSLSGVSGDDSGMAALVLSILLKLAAALLLVALAMRYLLPRLMLLLARSQELMLVFAIAWGTSLAALGEMAGFSKEVGAFLAGFSLASTPYRESVAARLASIRDFLLLFFFVELGAHLQFDTLGEELLPALIFSVFVLIGNPLIVMAIMGYMGYRRRTGFMAGLTVAQISEFSIVFVAMGITLGHVDSSALSLITLVGLVTITLSTYMILNSQELYQYFQHWLTPFERRHPFREAATDNAPASGHEVVVFGLGRYGGRFVRKAIERGFDVLAVDFDPEVIRAARHQGLRVHYGDLENRDFLAELELNRVRWVVSTVPDLKANIGLVQALRERGFAGALAVTAHSDKEEAILTTMGVDKVLFPHRDAADYAAEVICKPQ